MRRLIVALMLLSAAAPAAEVATQTPLARDGDWQVTLITMPDRRPVCAVGRGEIEHGFWMKAQMGEGNKPLGYLELRNTNWMTVQPGDLAMRFDDGSGMTAHFGATRGAVLISFRDQWSNFDRMLDEMSSKAAATITLTDRQVDAMQINLAMPTGARDMFRQCVTEHLLKST